MRRVPFGSEAGAFRFTLAAAAVIGASVVIGWVDAPVAGLVVFVAATVSAALSRLRVVLRDRPAPLRRAMGEAALNPASTDYLFFVAKADGSGGHNFSSTIHQHTAAVAEYHRNLKK